MQLTKPVENRSISAKIMDITNIVMGTCLVLMSCCCAVCIGSTFFWNEMQDATWVFFFNISFWGASVFLALAVAALVIKMIAERFK